MLAGFNAWSEAVGQLGQRQAISPNLQAIIVYAGWSTCVYGVGPWMAALLLDVVGIGSCCMAYHELLMMMHCLDRAGVGRE